jgi:superfamily II DNA or RNA helicase
MAFMPFSSLSLEKISLCRNLKDLAPSDQQATLLSGLEVLHKGHLKGHKIQRNEDGALRFEFYFENPLDLAEATIKMGEREPQGHLDFECSSCHRLQEDDLCLHEWSTTILFWWAYAQDTSLLRRLEPQVAFFCRDFQECLNQSEDVISSSPVAGVPSDLSLDSLSLVFDELPLKGSAHIIDILPPMARAYQLQEVPYIEDPKNSYLWDMPTVFRKPLSIETVFYWSDLKKQNQLAALLRYNFSDGTQVSSREILRHPYVAKVPRELLPSSARKLSAEPSWPLLPRTKESFISRELNEIEEVMQELLRRVLKKLQAKQLVLNLGAEGNPNVGLQIKEVSLEVSEYFHWDIQFEGESSVMTRAALRSFEIHRRFMFFQSFALDIENNLLVVFPWGREAEVLQDFFKQTHELKVTDIFSPFSIEGHQETSLFLKVLRLRPLPIQIRGGSHRLSSKSSALEVHFKSSGTFHLEHVFERSEKGPVRQVGWSTPAVLVLKALSQGLTTVIQGDLKSIITRAGKKRDWDLRLMRHLGVLQYVTLEALSLRFEGRLTDGSVCEEQNLVTALHSSIQVLLVAGESTVMDRDLPLTELCSRTAISCLYSFVNQVFKAIQDSSSVFDVDGELIYQGTVERDLRLLLELLKQLSNSSQGQCFKKTRTSFLSRIWDGDIEKDLFLKNGDFFFPPLSKGPLPVSQCLLLLHSLKGYGVRLLLDGKSLVELSENEFRVDFNIVSNLEDKMINWFELDPRFFLQGQEVDPASFSNLGGGGVLEYNGQFYILPKTEIPSMRRLENFWHKLQQGKKEGAKKKWADKVYQIPKSQTLDLLALRASGVAIRGDEEWRKLCSFYDNLGGIKKLLKIPSSVKGELKHYQHQGLQWLYDLYQLKLGALLADDMGLGKTLQALTFLDFLRNNDELGQVLIVVPSSLVYNWENEVAKFTPELPLQIFTSKDLNTVGRKLESKLPLVVLTTYGLLMENDQFLSQYKWNILIFDEAQNLKNISTKRTGAARMLVARFKICMTGTPMENHYGEFYSLMDLIVPGCLGKYEDFRRHYVNTDVVLLEDIEDLKLRAKPLLMRRTKKEILDQLPEKQETKVSIAFEESQKRIYRDIALAYNDKIQQTMKDSSVGQVQLQMLTALLRLRQACSDPSALPEVKYDKVPPKLEALKDSLQEIIESGESALVFTQFIQTLEHTEKILRELKIPVFVLHGAVPTKQRQKILKDFDSHPGGAVLAMTLKTGGVGLNLTKASYVFHLEPWWNPSVENQATDRAHRLGQRKAVQVFRYIMHESLEEKMEQLKERKQKKFQSLFVDSESINDLNSSSSALTKEDFDFLLGIR